MSGRGGVGIDGAVIAAEAARRRRGGPPAKQGSAMSALFNVFPLILIPVFIYNAIAWGGSAFEGAERVRDRMLEPAFSIPMASQVQWAITWGDILLFLALILLFVELLKSTSTGAAAIFNHALSMCVFILCLIEFLLHPAFATSVFFMIMVMSLLDVLAGVIVTIVSARRDVEFDKAH